MSYILVTGGAGYIGSVLANKLCKNHRVIVIDNLSNGSANFLNKNIIFHKIDICNYKKLKNIFSKYNIVSVFHFAALKSVSDSQKYYKKYFKNNVLGTVNLLKNIATFKVGEIIFSSSCSVYGNIDKKKVREIDPRKPISNYAKTKLRSEKDIVAYALQFHFKYSILRYFNVMGADKNLKSGELKRGPLFKNISNNIVNNNLKIEVYGNKFLTKDYTAVRDYIDVNDLVNLHIRSHSLLKKNKSFVLNLGYGEGYSVNEIINFFEKTLKCKIKILYKNKRDGDVSQIVANNHKMKKLFPSWTRSFSISQSIKNSILWEKKLKKLNLAT